MNKKQFLRKAFMLVGAVVSLSLFSACSESDGDVTDDFADWQQKNDTYFNKVYTEAQNAVKSGSTEWKVMTKWSINEASAQATDHIVAKVLQKGEGTVSPVFTDYVNVHYRGRLIPTANYPEGRVFDQSFTSQELNTQTAYPTYFQINNIQADGFATALQYMHVGDYWRVYVPYALGYGAAIMDNIPAYSTLVFDIYLCRFSADDRDVISWKAKENTWIE